MHLNGQYILNPCSIDHNYCGALYQVTILNHYLEIILLSITVSILQTSLGIGRCAIEGCSAALGWNLPMLSSNVSEMSDLARAVFAELLRQPSNNFRIMDESLCFYITPTFLFDLFLKILQGISLRRKKLHGINSMTTVFTCF